MSPRPERMHSALTAYFCAPEYSGYHAASVEILPLAGVVVVQFHDGADEILNHQGHEGSRRLLAPDISFVYLGGLGGERFRKQHPNRRGGVAQFHDGADEILNHQGHEGSRRLLVSDGSFVYLGGLGG